MYLAAKDFANDLIASVRFQRMPTFHVRYRTIDVLRARLTGRKSCQAGRDAGGRGGGTS